jgi:hypothetical protein
MKIYAVLSDKTVWPLVTNTLEWELRYGKPTYEQLLMACSIVSAYKTLINATQKRREFVIRELKKELKGGK